MGLFGPYLLKQYNTNSFFQFIKNREKFQVINVKYNGFQIMIDTKQLMGKEKKILIHEMGLIRKSLVKIICQE